MKVYIVIEEYDPYINFPDISSMTQQTIHAVCSTSELAASRGKRLNKEIKNGMDD